MTKIKDNIPMEQIISRQFRLWEQTYEKGKTSQKILKNPSITISKELGSQGLELAQKLSERLNWKLFDRELVDYIADNANVRKNMVEIFDEKHQNELHNWVLTLLDHHALGSDKYFKQLVTVIMAIGEHGRSIIVGRGGHFILPSDKTLKIKTVAPLENRINHIIEQQNVSRKVASEIIANADKERTAFIRRFFHQNTEEPLDYDLVLNMGNLDLCAGEEIIIHALQSKFNNASIVVSN